MFSSVSKQIDILNLLLADIGSIGKLEEDSNMSIDIEEVD